MGRIAEIRPNDVTNGQGIMVSVWFQGCHHHCKDCFNPETWSFKGGEMFTEEHIDKVLSSIYANGIKRDVSLLGGDPLAPENFDNALRLCKMIKLYFPEVKIYVWTGYLYENLNAIVKYKELFHYIDYLIDGKFDYTKKDLNLMLRGSSNQRIIDVKKTIKQNSIILAKELY